jgi:hypothetical protein
LSIAAPRATILPMQHHIVWLALALPLPVWAQDTAKPSQPPAGHTAQARLQQLQAEQRQLVTAWRTQMQEAQKAAEQAKADGKPIPAMPMRPDMTELRAKYLAAAEEFTGEDAVQFLLPALNMGEREQMKEVLDVLLADHIASPKLTQLGSMLPNLKDIAGDEYAAQALAKIEKDGSNQALLGWVAFARHGATLRAQPPSSQAFQDAKQQLLAATEKVTDARLAQQVKSLIAEQETFGNGMTAPDIAGHDLDGVAFKLSDYKGKVIFLDFWGDW